MAKLQGKVALVTGGNSGIGRAIAVRFAQEGAAVAIAARRLDRSRYLVAEIESTRGKAMAVAMDVTDAGQVEEGVAEVVRRYARIDVLVNAAGVMHQGEVAASEVADLDALYATNLRGPFVVSRAVLRHMIPAGRGGHVVHVASLAGLEAWAGTGLYSASKFGLVGLGQAMAAELEPHGIRVTTLCPALVDTPMVPAAVPIDRKAMLRPEDVAEAALYALTAGPNVRLTRLVLERRGAD